MDSELFKVVLQGGSFGLLAIAVIWMLFRGSPMLRDSYVRMSTDHREAVQSLVAEFRTELREQRAWLSEELDKRDAALDRNSQAIARLSERLDRQSH